MAEDIASSLDLVERAKRGDAAAFAGLIARHERGCLAIAYAKLRDAEAAGDVVQEAFLKAWEKIGSLGSAASFGGWLGQIVRNLATDVMRTRQRRGGAEAFVEAIDEHAANPRDAVSGQEMKKAIDAALGRLDETTRELVVLRYFDGLGSKEIGAVTGMTPAAVDMRLSRARQELRGMLEKSVDPFSWDMKV